MKRTGIYSLKASGAGRRTDVYRNTERQAQQHQQPTDLSTSTSSDSSATNGGISAACELGAVVGPGEWRRFTQMPMALTFHGLAIEWNILTMFEFIGLIRACSRSTFLAQFC